MVSTKWNQSPALASLAAIRAASLANSAASWAESSPSRDSISLAQSKASSAISVYSESREALVGSLAYFSASAK